MAMLFCSLWFGHSCVSCYILTAAVSWWQHVIHPPLSNELSIVKCDFRSREIRSGSGEQCFMFDNVKEFFVFCAAQLILSDVCM